MSCLSPNPNPIPPELPTDPSRSPPPDLPINVPPEKGPSRPQPIPPTPSPPPPVVRGWIAAFSLVVALAATSGASAQRPAGKDTSELERPHPQQTQCSQITEAEERVRCLERNETSGEPALGKPPEAEKPPPIPPTIGREMRPAPSGEAQKPTDPNLPALSR